MLRPSLLAVLACLAVYLCLPGRCAAQQFAWAAQATTCSSVTNAVITNDGYSYLGSNFADSLFFDGQRILSIVRSGSHHYGVGVGKFDPAGKLIRVVTNGGTGNASLLGMCSDGLGNIYLIGAFTGTISFGGMTMSSPSLYTSSYFVTKCDSSGNFLWVRSYNNPSTPNLNETITLSSIVCDGTNNVFLLGNTTDTYYNNGLSLTTPANDTHIFLAALSPANGIAVWTRIIEGNGTKTAKKIIADAANDLIVVGQYGSCCGLISQSSVFNGTDTLSTGGVLSENTFVAKYTTSGVYKWARAIGTILYNPFGGITSDAGRNIYFIGQLADLSSGSVDYIHIVRKISPGGTTLWTQPFWVHNNSIAAGASGLYALTSFTDDFQYGGISVSALGRHFLIVKMDTATGNLLWATPPLDSTSSYTALAASDRGTVLYSGSGINYPYGAHFGGHYLINSISSGYVPIWGRTAFVSLLTDTGYAAPNYNRISGSIYHDADQNCSLTPGDNGLNNFPVIATPGPWYGVSDASGHYSVKVPSGTYTVQQIPLKGHHLLDSLVCDLGGHTVTFTGGGQHISGQDFGHRYHGCSLMKLDAVSQRFDCGAAKTRTFTLCNLGLDTARSIELKIHYPGSLVEPVSSSIPWTAWTAADSTLRFNFSVFPPDSCLMIVVRDTAICPGIPLTRDFPFVAEITPFTGCYGVDTAYSIARFIDQVNGQVGVPAVAGNKQLLPEIFPNPTKGMVNISHLSGNERISVLSMMGQKVTESEARGAHLINLDLSALPPGCYFMLISSPDGSITSRVMKI